MIYVKLEISDERGRNMIERAYLEIGNICNLACSFCHGTRRAPRQMSGDEFRLVLSRLSGKVKNIYLHLMGEPFYHPELFSFLEIARDFDFRISITTNGSLLDGTADKLCSFSDIVHKVSISLHAPEANGVRDFSQYLGCVIDFTQKISSSGIYAVMRLWNLDSAEREGKNSFNKEILEFIKESFPEPWQSRPSGFRIDRNIFLEYAEIFTWPEDSKDEPREHGFCHALSQQIGILADGSVVPCCLDAEGSMVLGNIFKQELDDIMSSERADSMRKGFIQSRLTEPLCRTCSYSKRFKAK